MYNSQVLVANIKARAKERHILIRDMLTACDLSVNTISQISDKKGLSSFSLGRIADYLDCSVDYLLGRETANESTNISHVSNSVVMHTNRGNHVSISNGTSDSDNQLSEQEEELVRTFRTLDMRRKTTALTFLYELEDQATEKRV